MEGRSRRGRQGCPPPPRFVNCLVLSHWSFSVFDIPNLVCLWNGPSATKDSPPVCSNILHKSSKGSTLQRKKSTVWCWQLQSTHPALESHNWLVMYSLYVTTPSPRISSLTVFSVRYQLRNNSDIPSGGSMGSLSAHFFSLSCSFRQKLWQTRMYSSRIRTTRFNGHLYARGCLPIVSVQGGVCLRGCLPGALCPRGVCLGVSAQGGVHSQTQRQT